VNGETARVPSLLGNMIASTYRLLSCMSVSDMLLTAEQRGITSRIAKLSQQGLNTTSHHPEEKCPLVDAFLCSLAKKASS
jgi:hypothetical protein